MTTTGSGRETLLIEAFVVLADTLVDDYDVIDLLDRLVSYSVELLAADAAGIWPTLWAICVAASSNEQSDWMELTQLQADEGPCVECFRTGAPVSIGDLAEAAQRWPRFVAAVMEQGLTLGAFPAASAARGSHWHAEPVSSASGPTVRRRSRPGSGIGRRAIHTFY